MAGGSAVAVEAEHCSSRGHSLDGMVPDGTALMAQPRWDSPNGTILMAQPVAIMVPGCSCCGWELLCQMVPARARQGCCDSPGCPWARAGWQQTAPKLFSAGAAAGEEVPWAGQGLWTAPKPLGQNGRAGMTGFFLQNAKQPGTK